MVEILWPEFLLLWRTFLLFLEIAFPLVCNGYDGNCVIRHESKRRAEVSLSKPSCGLVMSTSFTFDYQNKSYWVIPHSINKNVLRFYTPILSMTTWIILLPNCKSLKSNFLMSSRLPLCSVFYFNLLYFSSNVIPSE